MSLMFCTPPTTTTSDVPLTMTSVPVSVLGYRK
jgi:hypothetical protein